MAKLKASELREGARAYALERGETAEVAAIDAQNNWAPYLIEHNVELMFDWTEDDGGPPEAVMSQLVGQPVGCGMRFAYEGVVCFVVSTDLDDDVGKPYTEEMKVYHCNLAAVPGVLIDMNA